MSSFSVRQFKKKEENRWLFKRRNLKVSKDYSHSYEVVSKIFQTDVAIYTAVVVARSTIDGRTAMSSESVCQVAHSWVEVGNFHTRLFGVVYVTYGDFHDGSEKERRVCIKFCASLGKSATETLTMIQQAFLDQSLSRTQVFHWHARFKTGRTSVDDDEHTGRHRSCTIPETVA